MNELTQEMAELLCDLALLDLTGCPYQMQLCNLVRKIYDAGYQRPKTIDVHGEVRR